MNSTLTNIQRFFGKKTPEELVSSLFREIRKGTLLLNEFKLR